MRTTRVMKLSLFSFAMLFITTLCVVEAQEVEILNNKLSFFESGVERGSLGYGSSNLSLKNTKDFGWTIMDAKQRLELRINGVSQAFIDNNGNLVSKRFTGLGSDAPKIKMKTLTATSSASNVGATQVAHGLGDADRILSVQVYMNLGDEESPAYYPPNVQFSTFNYLYFITDFNITVQNNASQGTSIQSKPLRILMTYKE